MTSGSLQLLFPLHVFLSQGGKNKKNNSEKESLKYKYLNLFCHQCERIYCCISTN